MAPHGRTEGGEGDTLRTIHTYHKTLIPGNQKHLFRSPIELSLQISTYAIHLECQSVKFQDNSVQRILYQ
jgi:hypothetical protein